MTLLKIASLYAKPVNTKPTGLLELNPNSVMVANKMCYLLDGSVPINLANPHEIITKLGSNPADFKGTPTGAAVFLDNTAASTSTNSACYNLPPIGPMTHGWLLVRFKSVSLSSSNSYIFGHGDSPAGKRLYIYITTSGVSGRLGGNSGSSPRPLTAGVWHNVLLRWGNGSGRIYVDGDLGSTVQNSSGTPGSLLDATHIGQFRNPVPTTLGAFDGEIALVAMGTDSIGASEARALTRDPYQIVRPASPTEYYLSTPGGGGVTGTGSLVSADSTISGVGQLEHTGTGSLVSADSTISGVGQLEHTGTGSLVSADSTISGAGQREHTGTGSLVSADSTVAGIGAIAGAIVGTGSLVSADSTISGVGQLEHTGTGSLVSADSTVAGIGAIAGAVVGTGSLVSADSTISGAGQREHTGTGSLVVGVSVVSGVGTTAGGITGTGSLVVEASTVAGAGSRVVKGAAVLVSNNSTLIGIGVRGILGTGSLVSSSSTLLGLQSPDVVTPDVRRASVLARTNTAQVVASPSRRASVPANNRTQQVLSSNRRAQPED